jgi:phosphate ABC transporter phosphate-binding protein
MNAQHRRSIRVVGALTMVFAAFTFASPAQPAFADGPTLHAAGSTWVQIALQQWTSDVARFGLNIDYQGIGSTAGRQNYMYNLIDFAATEIPYQPDELAQYHAELKSRFRTYQYIPDVAGGTSFMYNLVDPTTGRRITDLRLSSGTIAKIFTGHVTSWHDPSILADNPGLNLPNMPLTPVVRSDSSGTSGQLSLFLQATQPSLWNPFAAANGCPAPCASWPTNPPFIGQSLSSGVTNFVASTPGTINYVEAGYALAKGFPVAYVHNASGNWALPLSQNVSTALTHATLNADLTQNLGGVYNAPEPNAYPVSSYSYLITPTSVIDPAKGLVLGKFLLYVACAGQQEAPLLGYSPLPLQLVTFVFQAINRINGHPPTPDLSTPQGRAACPNPTWTNSGGGGGGPTPNGGGGGGGGGATNSGSGSNAGTSGNANNSSTSGRSAHSAAPSTTTSTGALKVARGTNLGQGGSGVFGTQSDSGSLTTAEQTATVLAARRQAAYGSLSNVHSETETALEWAALYVPILIYGPILVRRRRSNRISKRETPSVA